MIKKLYEGFFLESTIMLLNLRFIDWTLNPAGTFLIILIRECVLSKSLRDNSITCPAAQYGPVCVNTTLWEGLLLFQVGNWCN